MHFVQHFEFVIYFKTKDDQDFINGQLFSMYDFKGLCQDSA